LSSYLIFSHCWELDSFWPGDTHISRRRDRKLKRKAIDEIFAAIGKPFLGDIYPIFKNVPSWALHQVKIKWKSLVAIMELRLANHRKSFDENNPKDFVDHLFLEGDRISKIELLSLCLEQIGAGTDTTSTTVEWFCLMLCNYPQVQKKLQEELEQIIGRNRFPCISDSPNLPYFNSVIKEIMRWRTVVPLGLPRKTTEDVTVSAGYMIPKNTTIWTCFTAANFDPEIYENPKEFQAERYLKEGVPEPAVFGSGPRECLGKNLGKNEVFLLASHLVHQFHFQSTDGKKVDDTPVFGLTYQPKPFQIRLTVRS